MQYPKPLLPGSRIAVTACSSGVPKPLHPRLNRVLDGLRDQGFEVIEGQCLREDTQHVSAEKTRRAKELMDFLCDETIDAVIPPWGGERAIELLELLDYNRLKQVKPKWILGFSDTSTLMVALTTRLGWSTAHGANLMQLVPEESEPLTSNTLSYLGEPETFTQYASSHYQIKQKDFAIHPAAGLNLTEPTSWKVLDGGEQLQMKGRLIGGCLDTLIHTLGTEYFDLRQLHEQYRQDGLILYLENAEQTPPALYRALTGFKYKGVFDRVNGVLLGRNAVIDSPDTEFTGLDAIQMTLGALPVPVIYDADIGHLPPNMTLLNGALCEISVKQGRASMVQSLT